MRQDAGLRPERLEPQPREEAALGPRDVGARARGRSARRRRSTDAGPCAASRPSARRRASGPRAGSGRRARRPGRPRAGRGGRRWPGGGRAAARARSGPITSYGGATTSGQVGDRRPGRSAARGTVGSRARDLQDGGTLAGRLSGRPHRTIAAARRDRARDRRSRRATFDGAETSLLRPTRSRRPRWSLRAPPSPVRSRRRARRVPAGARLAVSTAPPGDPRPRPAAPRGRGRRASTMEARVLLDGHARVGSWMAIAVHLKNDGPAVSGELRLAGGSQGRTRFGAPSTCRPSRTRPSSLYAQPPAFGRELEIALSTATRRSPRPRSPFTIHDATQLVVGVVAERPGRHRRRDRPPAQPEPGRARSSCPLDPEDLPERVEAWGALDRLVWQDVDSNRLTTGQLAALRGWVAGGGRLVIVGGTAGPEHAVGVPGHAAPLPADRHHRRPGRQR